MQKTNKLFDSTRLFFTRKNIDNAKLKGTNKVTIIYVSRQHAKSRKFGNDDEKKFYKKLESVQNSLVINFDGATESMYIALSLFGSANVVIGIHGAGLSNVLFCKPGTTLIEFGFTNPMGSHFEHVAKSLGMNYLKFFISNRFKHGMSTDVVKIKDEILDEAIHFLNRMSNSNKKNIGKARMAKSDL